MLLCLRIGAFVCAWVLCVCVCDILACIWVCAYVCVCACVLVSVIFWYPWMIPDSRVPAVDTVSRFICDKAPKIVSGQDFVLDKYFIIILLL